MKTRCTLNITPSLKTARINQSIKFVLLLGLTVLAPALTSCSESSYKKGPSKSNQETGSNLGQQSSKSDASTTGTKNIPMSREGNNSEITPPAKPQQQTTEAGGFRFNTGVSACIASEIATVRPREISKTLADFQSFVTVASLEDLTQLGDLILREVVSPEQGLVDYEALRNTLKTPWAILIDGLATIPPAVGSFDNQVAYWINAYNFLMMNRIVENPGVESVGDLDSGNFSVFNIQHEIGGHSLSLNQIEYWVLGVGAESNRSTSDQPATELLVPTKEVRLHAALVCGAIGCPRLRNFAYRPEDLKTLLDEDFYIFINETRHISEGGAKVSELFTWFKPDFLQFSNENLAAIPEQYILSTCRSDKSSVIATFQDGQSSNFPIIKYDWAINHQ